MMIRLQFGIAVLILLASTSAYAKLTQCRPTPKCVLTDGVEELPTNPCHMFIDQGETKTLKPSPVAGAGIIRVHLCDVPSDAEPCGSHGGPLWQEVSVLGYAGNQKVYAKTLSGKSGPIDTGPYTKIDGLSRLDVHCKTAETKDAKCSLIWQICREELSLQIP